MHARGKNWNRKKRFRMTSTPWHQLIISPPSFFYQNATIDTYVDMLRLDMQRLPLQGRPRSVICHSPHCSLESDTSLILLIIIGLL